MHNIYFYLIISITVIFFLFDRFIDYLNSKTWSEKLPEELKGFYDEEKYRLAQEYDQERNHISKIKSTISIVITLGLLLIGGFGLFDSFLRTFTENSIYLSLMFFGAISLINSIVAIPFSWYSTFHIEEKYGFNKSTPKVFVLDQIKSIILSFVVGGILLSLLVWIYEKIGANFWMYAFLIISGFSIAIAFLYSTIIVPLFNKQTPLEDGMLKDSILEFCKKVDFKLDNVYVIDGSKRSTKANAYFTGFGSKKRIVLFDTLIDNYSTEEIVAVLAHEIGHYKKKHVIKSMILGILQVGLLFFLSSLILENKDIALALGASQASFHIGIFAFGILFTPLNTVLEILMNIFSRKNENEADEFAGKNCDSTYLQSALKKLSVDNLSNLTPHPVYEFINYSHPSVLKRIQHLEELK